MRPRHLLTIGSPYGDCVQALVMPDAEVRVTRFGKDGTSRVARAASPETARELAQRMLDDPTLGEEHAASVAGQEGG